MTGRSKTFLVTLSLAGAFAAGWLVQSWRADAAAARIEVRQAGEEVAQAQQSQAATENQASALLEHAGAQQENTHGYTHKMAELEAGRAADAARIAGLQRAISAAATRNAQAAGDTAACRALTNQHQRLAALAAAGAGLVGEFGSLVERQDAQVKLLSGQIAVDRQLLEPLP